MIWFDSTGDVLNADISATYRLYAIALTPRIALSRKDAGEANNQIPAVFPDLSGVETGPALSGNPPALSGNPPALSGNPPALSGKPPIIPPDVPADLAERISTLGQRVSQPDLAQLAIDLCRHRTYSTDQLATILGKKRKYLLDRVLTPLLRNGQLRHTIPDQPNHPNQAYTVGEKDEG